VVAVEGTTTRPFALKQGVKQGSVLSPILYAAFIDSIVTELKEAQLRATIHEEWIGALLYADDMVFSEWEPERLQRMIDVLDEHARTWRYEPSATKTKILATLGPTEYQWHLRGTPLRLR
jgi:retron-type reverse transcriptase